MHDSGQTTTNLKPECFGHFGEGPFPLLFTTILERFPTEMQTMALIVAWPGQNASSGTKGVVKYDDHRAKGAQTDLRIESLSKKWMFEKNC